MFGERIKKWYCNSIIVVTSDLSLALHFLGLGCGMRRAQQALLPLRIEPSFTAIAHTCLSMSMLEAWTGPLPLP